MTEAEWLAATVSEAMLLYLKGSASERKLQLFSSASFRRLITLLPDPRQHQGIEVLEQLADGLFSRNDCQGIAAAVRRAIQQDEHPTVPTDDPHYIALMLYREFCSTSVAIHAVQATAGLAEGLEEQRQQSLLMRDIFGNPFRHVAFDPNWRTSTVVSLAQGMYQTGDFSPLSLLGDALQDAGCENEDILNHCRGEGPHVRGCWVVDLILGKE